jgi:hypothetical protein
MSNCVTNHTTYQPSEYDYDYQDKKYLKQEQQMERLIAGYEKNAFTRKPKTASQETRMRERKVRESEKVLEKKNRLPSNRLGKNAKKIAGRRALVLENIEVINEEVVVVAAEALPVKSARVPLGRVKSKVSHRVGRPKPTAFPRDDDEDEFPNIDREDDEEVYVMY